MGAWNLNTFRFGGDWRPLAHHPLTFGEPGSLGMCKGFGFILRCDILHTVTVDHRFGDWEHFGIPTEPTHPRIRPSDPSDPGQILPC